MKRRFEFSEGTSNKFWEIEVNGASHVVHFGRIGTAGQTKAKSFSSNAAAQADADKLAYEKVDKGYSEITDEEPGGAPSATLAATKTPKKQAPKADPKEAPRAPAPKAMARRVTLTSRDHTIALTLAENRVATNDVVQELDSPALAQEHFDRVLMLRKKGGYVITRDEEVPDDTSDLPTPDENLEFKTEFDRWMVVFKGEDRASPQQCDKVVARLMKDTPASAQLVCDFAYPADAWPQRIHGKSFPFLNAFIFDTYFQSVTRQSKNSIGDLAAMIRACPNLEKLFATGDLTLSEVNATKLKEAYFLGCPLSAKCLEGIAASHFPALERIVISFENAEAAQEYAAEIAKLDAPKLSHFHAADLDETTFFLAALADAKIPKSIRTLVLGGQIDDEDDFFTVVEKHAPRLRELDAFAAPLGDCVSSDTEEKIRALLPNTKDTSEFHDDTVPAAYKGWRS